VKAKCVPLGPVAVAALTSTTTTELGTQVVQAMPDIRHLAVKVLYCRVELSK
jgi:hypothetical protein